MLVVVNDLKGKDAVAVVEFPANPIASSSHIRLFLGCFRPFLFFLFLRLDLFLLHLSFFSLNFSFNHFRAGSGRSTAIRGRVWGSGTF